MNIAKKTLKKTGEPRADAKQADIDRLNEILSEVSDDIVKLLRGVNEQSQDIDE